MMSDLMLWRVLLLLMLNASVSKCGYFQILFTLSNWCPFIQFCTPWNPHGQENFKIVLWNNTDFRFELGHLILPGLIKRRGVVKRSLNSCDTIKANQLQLLSANESSLCYSKSDTGSIFCPAENDKLSFYPNDFITKRMYTLPRRCLKSVDPAHRASFYKRIFLSRSYEDHSSIDIIIRSNSVIIKIQPSLTRHFLRCPFDWKSDIVIREMLDKNVEANCSTFIEQKKDNKDDLSNLEVNIENYVHFKVTMKTTQGIRHLTMDILDLKTFWAKNKHKSDNVNISVDGLLGSQTNFSSAFETSYFSNQNCDSKAISGCTCYNGNFDSIASMIFFKQACCEKGLEAAIKQSDHSCSSKKCCKRTKLEAALWNRDVRGQCWVIKPITKEVSRIYLNNNGTTVDGQEATVSVSAAYGIIALCTVFVLSFRAVTAKLDECRRRYVV